MPKIPNNGRFSQTNNSDLFGNIHITKNINFDEEGYLKSSSRTVSLRNETDDTAFNIPVSYGRNFLGSFFLATTETPYILTIGNTSVSLAVDTDSGNDPAPDLDFVTYGKWWRNRWHVTNDTQLYYKTLSNGDWTDTGITALTASVPHPMESFEKANTLVIADGNTVRQLNSSYAVASLAQLTLSTDYEVIGLAYNNNQLGIATRLSSTIEGQNKEAQFFVWDGSESSANEGYSVGSDSIITIAPYKSSFVILTRAGQLMYFNGGGFQELASFPVYFKETIWGSMTNRDGYGDMMKVDGDIILININSQIIDNKLNSYMDTMIGGVWCYDPKVGLYHRYSPSISKAQFLYSRAEDVDTVNDILTVFNSFSYPTTPIIPPTGSPAKIASSAISGLIEGNIYYIIKTGSTTYKLAETYTNAINGIAVNITSTGSLFVMALDVKDYGQSKTSRPGGIALMGYKAHPYDNVIFGGEYYESASDVAHLNISVAGFKNISYFVTSKIVSTEVEDNIPKVYIKYRPLGVNDSIIVKYKNKDYYGLPQTAQCTATSPTEMYTTANLLEAYNLATSTGYGHNGKVLECEIISGNGAGQMATVLSMGYDAGTYSLVLDSEIEGLSSADVISIKLDNWEEIATITNDNTNNWQEIPLAKNSKWTKMKVVLIGSVTIEELLPVNAIFKSAK